MSIDDHFDFLERRHQKQVDEADSAWERCSRWWKENVPFKARNGVPLWDEDKEPPGARADVLDQYRYWLFEHEKQPSKEAMTEFIDEMAEFEYEEWLEWGRDDFPWC